MRDPTPPSGPAASRAPSAMLDARLAPAPSPPPDGGEAGGRGSWRRRLGRPLLVLAIFGLALYLLLPQAGGLGRSLEVLRSMRHWAVGLAVLSEILSYVALGYMRRRIVALSGQELTLHRAFAVTLAAGSVGVLAGGLMGMGASSFKWLRDAGIRAEGAVLAGLLPALLDVGVVAVFAMMGMGVLVAAGDVSRSLTLAFAASMLVLAAAGVALAWAFGHRERARRIAAALRRAACRVLRRAPDLGRQNEAIDRLFDALLVLKTRGWHAPLAGAAMYSVLDMGALYFLFIAAHHPVTPGQLLAGYSLPFLIGKVGIFPGGLGLIETTMSALFHGFGVATATAVLVVLAFRLVTFWMPVLLGFAIIPLLHIPPKRTGAELRP